MRRPRPLHSGRAPHHAIGADPHGPSCGLCWPKRDETQHSWKSAHLGSHRSCGGLWGGGRPSTWVAWRTASRTPVGCACRRLQLRAWWRKASKSASRIAGEKRSQAARLSRGRLCVLGQATCWHDAVSKSMREEERSRAELGKASHKISSRAWLCIRGGVICFSGYPQEASVGISARSSLHAIPCRDHPLAASQRDCDRARNRWCFLTSACIFQCAVSHAQHCQCKRSLSAV